jgi:hypothetical protein
VEIGGVKWQIYGIEVILHEILFDGFTQGVFVDVSSKTAESHPK